MKIDELDRKILRLLAGDGRMPSAEISRLVGAPERTVSYRIKTLVQKDAISIVGIINHNYFGYDVIGDVFCRVENADLEEVAINLAGFPEVSYLTISFGDNDISLQVLCKSNAELLEFVSKKLLKVPGIAKTTTVIVPNIIKDSYQWVPPELLDPEEEKKGDNGG